MKILFVISLIAFFALLWAAFAITRHIRRSPAAPLESNHDFVPVAPAPKPKRQKQSGASGRSDWQYFNKDSGDLKDPARRGQSRAANRKPAARRA